MLTLYISGPMGSLPDHNYPAFLQAEQQLSQAGFKLLNPARNHPQDGSASREHYMRLDYRNVLDADGLALLPGNAYSPGAKSEINMALDLGLPIATVEWWIVLGQMHHASTNALRSYVHGNGSPELAGDIVKAMEHGVINMQMMARHPMSQRVGLKGGAS